MSKYTIEARVRNVEDADGLYLGDFAPDQIPALPNLFRTFPTYDGDFADRRFDFAHFVCAEDGSIYFEIVVARPAD